MLPLPSSAAETGAEGDDMASARPPRILVTSRPPRHLVDYVDQLLGDDSAGEAGDGVVLEFRTDPFRVRDIDVIHLTDISKVIGTSRTPERERLRRAKRFMKMLRRQGIGLVRSIHSDELEQPSSRAAAVIDSSASAVLALDAAAVSAGRATSAIHHSHLRDRFLGFPRAASVAGRVLISTSGPLHRSDESALKVFAVADLSEWTLRVTGLVPFDLEDSFARTLADHFDTISLRNETLSDAERVSEVEKAEVVMVTELNTYAGQSTALLALSLDRPVLVEDTKSARALADEVGTEWVRRYAGPLTAYTLEASLAALRDHPPIDHPSLDSREPNAIRAQYIDAYRAAVASR